MNIRKTVAAVTAAVMALSLAACAKDDTSGGAETAETESSGAAAVTTEEVQTESSGAAAAAPEEVQTAALTPEEEDHIEMVKRSFVSFGNTYRLEKKLEQAAEGKDMTVAYIGGSITEGVGGTPDTCYAKLSCDCIAEKYGTGDNVKYVNAGVSGTPSVLGNLRVKKDVLDKNADIVFVEFAVNDGMEDLYKQSYESLVRTILSQDNEPAVILLFTVTKTGHTCQEHMKQIGEYYQLPMISVPDAIQPEIEAGRMTWEDYSDDEAHPNGEGHKLVSEFIAHYFTRLDTRSFEGNVAYSSYSMPIVPKFGNPYENAFLAEADYDNSNPDLQITSEGSFPAAARSIADFRKGAWVWDKENSEPLKFTARGSSIFFVCKRNNSAAMGKFDVYINGDKAGTIDTNQKEGWGEPFAFRAIKWQGVRDMEVEAVPSDDNEGEIIEIFAIAVAQNDSYI